MTKYCKKRPVKVPITKDDLTQLLQDSQKHFCDALKANPNKPMAKMHLGKKPVAIALCQGAAMHYQDGKTGYTDFDVYLFYEIDNSYPPRRRHPARYWKPPLCYKNAKYPCGDIQVDVLVRCIEVHGKNPTEIIHWFLRNGKSKTACCLSEKAVVLLHPPKQLGKVIWYDGEAVG